MPHPDVAALVADVRALHAVLPGFDHPLLSAGLARAATELAASDAHGLRRLLALYGGMGSLNDVPLSPADHALSTRIHTHATALLREVDQA